MDNGSRLRVATRKGLFTFERSSAGAWEIVDVAFVGDPVTIVLDDARDGSIYAGLNLGHFGVKLHRSADGGASWSELPAPAFPPEPSGLDATPAAPSVQQLWALEAGGAGREGRLWAGTIPGALFRTDDHGASWQRVDSLWNRPERENWFGGGYDEPGIHSVCVDPVDPDRVAVAVSCGGVWFSDDAGTSWECRTNGMFAAYMPPERRDDPSIQDPHRMVQAPSNPDVFWVQHHNGVFRTEDRGRSWSEIANVPPAVFGFAVAVHPRRPQTAWFVPAVKDECRVPVGGSLVVARTGDGGHSFDELRNGLPQEHAYDLVFRHALDVDAGGESLAMGSTTGSLWITEDEGDRWSHVTAHLPPIYQVRFG